MCGKFVACHAHYTLKNDIVLTYFVMIVLVHLPSKCARILDHFLLTKMYHQQRRVVYQNPFAYDLALLFIMSINKVVIL